MPFTLNGFGNHYFGKQRIHSIYARCEFCNSFDVLKSYDTSNYVVALFVPVFPLGERRVLNHCPRCQQFKTLPLRVWENSKRQAIDAMKAELATDEISAEPVKKAIGIAIEHQDLQLLNSVAQTLGGLFEHDAEVQTLLGEALVYFCKNAEAAAAFSRAHAITPSDSLNDRVGLAYLRSGRPKDAVPYANNALESGVIERLWLPKLMIKGFQGINDHAAAKQWFTSIITAHPLFQETAECKQMSVQIANAASLGVAVEDYFLHSKGIVVSESSKRRFAPVHLVAPAILVAAICLYLGIAWANGVYQTVYLVNGLHSPYEVTINDKTYRLESGQAKAITIEQGAVHVEPDANAPSTISRSEFRVETPFLTRPWSSPVFVINPDRNAILLHELTYYGTDPQNVPEGKMKIRVGKSNYEFKPIDYLFQPFPNEISVKSNLATRTRLSQEFVNNSQVQKLLAIATAPEAEIDMIDFLEQRIVHFSESDFLVHLLGESAPKERFEKFMHERLSDVPVRVSVHRYYQRLSLTNGDKDKLVDEYQSRLAIDPNSAALNYLLARITDSRPESEELFRKSISLDDSLSQVKADFALKLMGQGEFAIAAELAESIPVNPNHDPGFASIILSSLEAGGKTSSIPERSKLLRAPFSRSGVLCELRVIAKEKGLQQAFSYMDHGDYKAGRTDALENSLTNTDILAMVAWLYYASKEFDEYTATLSKSRELTTEYSTIIELLTEGYKGFLEPEAVFEKHGEQNWSDFAVAALLAKKQNDLEAFETLTSHCQRLLEHGTYEDKLLARLFIPQNAGRSAERLRDIHTGPTSKRLIGALLIAKTQKPDSDLVDFVRLMNYEVTHPYWIVNDLIESVR